MFYSHLGCFVLAERFRILSTIVAEIPSVLLKKFLFCLASAFFLNACTQL